MNAAKKVKLFGVRTAGGEIVKTEQLATFTRTICGEKFRFVVTRSIEGNGVNVTERATGYVVTSVPMNVRISEITTWRDRGDAALTRLIGNHGEQRVYDVMAQGQRAIARQGT